MFFIGREVPDMDSTTKTYLLNRLRSEIDAMPSALQRAAKYIIDYPGDFGLDPIRTSAEKIGVSANSLVRLAQHLGLDSFDELRGPFRQTLVTDHIIDPNDNWIEAMAARGGYAETQARAARNEINVLTRSLKLLTPKKAEAVISLLKGARNSYITATRSSYALAYFFHYVGRMSLPGLQLIPRHMGNPLDELMTMGAQDVLLAITFPPYSAETIDALKFANQRKAKVILLTDSEVVAPKIVVDELLQVAAYSTHHFGCYVGALAVLDCLLAHLHEQGDADAAARIAAYQEMREGFGAYWKAPKPRLLR